jgi:hypothetical protein
MRLQLESGAAQYEAERHSREIAEDHIEGTLALTPMAGVATLQVGRSSPTQAVLETA